MSPTETQKYIEELTVLRDQLIAEGHHEAAERVQETINRQYA